MDATVTEGKAKIMISGSSKISRKMPVFYNPAMKLDRDVSVLLLKSVKNKRLRIADPLAASGIRSIRFLLELDKSKVKEVVINDSSSSAVANIKSNLRLNKLGKNKKIKVANEEASVFLLKNRPFDYIDIDPFGSPVYFLDSAIKSLSRDGILAVTATDTAALAGTAPKACLRKYWSVPLKNYLMHELGLRILIRRAQLAAASNGKALIPVYSYSKLHYMRVFFRCGNKITDVNKILKQHNFVSYCGTCLSAEILSTKNICSNCKNKKVVIAGPMWSGNLFDSGLAASIYKNDSSSGDNFLKTISEESKIKTLGFYDTHIFSKRFKIRVPKLEAVITVLRENGFMAARTHFSGNGIRSGIGNKEFVRLLRRIRQSTEKSEI
ncbi:tRNA (guanine(10)-N(2))-dimethyltransferase [Candidatus Woesearchaeota archaeon]|nr:tRNA (guanine(10)-N(2))-dimethyltransferase [Candidatus Woesearchaeota archaeon]